jgi:hypothetical protein
VSWRVVRCVLEHLDVRGLDQLVLLHLANVAHHDGSGVTLGRIRLARRAGVAQETVRAALRRLMEQGRVTVDPGRGMQGVKLRRVVLCDACASEDPRSWNLPSSKAPKTGSRQSRHGRHMGRFQEDLPSSREKPAQELAPNLSGTVDPPGSTVLPPESGATTTAEAVAPPAPGSDERFKRVAAAIASARAVLARPPAANPTAPSAPRVTGPPPDPETLAAEKAAALAAFVAAYPEAAGRGPPSPNGADPDPDPAAKETRP